MSDELFVATRMRLREWLEAAEARNEPSITVYRNELRERMEQDHKVHVSSQTVKDAMLSEMSFRDEALVDPLELKESEVIVIYALPRSTTQA